MTDVRSGGHENQPPIVRSTQPSVSDRPEPGDRKEVWLNYRRSQGYTEDKLKGLTKEKLIKLRNK